MDLQTITRPTPVLDGRRCRRNIARMVQRARDAGVFLRPHFKTHQSPTVGEWMREAGVTAITVSSLEMAEAFAACGWDDITVAFLVNPRRLDEIARLARRVRLQVLVDDISVAATLAARFAAEGESRLGVRIKIDAGYGRTGIEWDDGDRVAEVARVIAAAPGLRFDGLLSHGGDTYAAEGADGVRDACARSLARLLETRRCLESAEGLPAEVPVSVGDTPACSLVADFGPATEIRPGNFVFFDLMQRRLGACADEDLAVALACPVVGVYPGRRRIAVHGGAVHFGREYLPTDAGPLFGLGAEWGGDGFGAVREDLRLVGLSQEHGLLDFDADVFGANPPRPGDVLCVFPAHSCLTCDPHAGYLDASGSFLARI